MLVDICYTPVKYTLIFSELTTSSTGIMVNVEFIGQVFSKIDGDGNGDISEDELVGAFKTFDTDGAS